MNDTLVIRPEEPADIPAIGEMNRIAFERPDEARIVEELRGSEDFDPALSLVASVRGSIVGHLLLTPVRVEGDRAAQSVLALAPMAVLPGWRRRGIGSGLIRAGFEAARRRGHRVVVVLGHPTYYARFGFVPASRQGIRAPFEVPDEAFLVRELVPGGLSGVAGTLQYPPALSAP